MRSFALRFSSIAVFFFAATYTLPAQPDPAALEITISVDASQAPSKILRAHLTIPVSPGALTLYYPKWIPGAHAPLGPISNLTGLKFTANGAAVSWKRDLRDVFAFHLDVPAGAKQLEVDLEYLEPTGLGGTTNGFASDKLMAFYWNQVVLYPAGFTADKVVFKPALTLPAGWKFGTALPVASQSGAQIRFQPAALDRLVDSPLIAGEYYRVIDITPPGEPVHHEIDIIADGPAALEMPPDISKGLTNLVAESGKLFGARHYREYHFLLTLSEFTVHFGLEHHESNDSRLSERVLLSPGGAREVGGLLAHEFAHSWSGKFRRPKDLATPDFQAPMETDLLWVYEGNTSYLGDLLAARSGLWTPADYRQALASYAANLGPGRPGRTWRPVQDTASAVSGTFGGGPPAAGWVNWRRGSDYYEEGELLWLEAANIVHDRSHGQKSFEDFFHLFYGGPNNGPEVKTYTFEELVQTLNQVAPYDWAAFWNDRLNSLRPEAPAGGITAGGWKVVFNSEPLPGGRISRGITSTTFGMGLSLAPDGTVTDTIHGGLAFQAGIAPGMKVIGVNGRLFTPDFLTDAVRAAASTTAPIQLLVVDDDYYKLCAIDYHGGERYPHLVRDAEKPDYLGELLKPLAPPN